MFSPKKQLRVETIDSITGVITTGRRAGRRIDTTLRRHQDVELGVDGTTAVVYDTRKWGIVFDPYNFYPPTDAAGERIRPARPVRAGWLVDIAHADTDDEWL